MWDGVTKSRANEPEDLRRRLIIRSARGCRVLFRADVVGFENVQMRSYSRDKGSCRRNHNERVSLCCSKVSVFLCEGV